MSFCWVRLSPPAQQHDQNLATLHELNPIAGAIVDSHFAQAFADGLNITGVAERQPVNPRLDTGFRAWVPKFSEPSVKAVTP